MAKHELTSMLAWRRKQKRGAIMKPKTFKKIVDDAMKRGLSKEAATKSAGYAYWKSARSKFKKVTS